MEYFKDRIRVRRPDEALTISNCAVLRVDDDWLRMLDKRQQQRKPKQLTADDFLNCRDFYYADITFYCEHGIFCIIRSPFEDEQQTNRAISLKFPDVFGEKLMLDEI